MMNGHRLGRSDSEMVKQKKKKKINKIKDSQPVDY
jgi:hypothetical protein